MSKTHIRKRDLVYQYHAEGLSRRQIADLTGLSYNTVKTLIRRMKV